MYTHPVAPPSTSSQLDQVEHQRAVEAPGKEVPGLVLDTSQHPHWKQHRIIAAIITHIPWQRNFVSMSWMRRVVLCQDILTQLVQVTNGKRAGEIQHSIATYINRHA
jgi:hypothetical protein